MVYHPCYLSGLSIDEEADQQTVLISESAGKRRFPIAIGQIEALAIDRAVKGQVFPRPLTHDLLLVTRCLARRADRDPHHRPAQRHFLR